MESTSDIAGIISSNTMIDRRSKHRNWGDLEQGILLKIFMLLNVMDLVGSVSQVCSTWRLVCHEPCLWETLDMNLLFQHQTPAGMILELQINRISRFLNLALSLSRGKISCLIFNFHIPITNQQLIHASKRTPNLKKLVLPLWSNDTLVSKFVEAAKNWPNLMSLTLPAPGFPKELIIAFGQNCKNLRELKIRCTFDRNWAENILAYAPSLKIISLRCSLVMGKDVILFLLKELRELEVLNISHCSILDELDLPDGSLGLLQLPELDESVLQEAARLKKFLFCQRHSCNVCQLRMIHLGYLSWRANNEDFWKVDEGDSLAH